MRIAFVNHRDWLEGGMDKVALTQHDGLKERGHHVAFFTQYHWKNRPSPYRHLYPRNADRYHYQFNLGRLPNLISDIRNTFYNPEAGRQFGRFLDEFNPDIVHVHGLMRAFSPSLYREAIARGIPLIQTHHYVKLICPTGKLLRAESQYCHDMPCISGNTLSCVRHRCQQSSRIRSLISALEFKINRNRYIEQPHLHLAPSYYLKDLLQEVGVQEDHLAHHPNFVDIRQFTPGQNQDKRNNTFLYFGRLSNEKGIETLLNAFGPLHRYTLLLVGDGPLKPYCEKRIETQGWEHIRLLGSLEPNQLIPLIQKAKATILPSIWGEIFGLSIIESMACATPVIGSRIGAIPELIHPGENGYLVDPGQVEALREAILTVARLPASVVSELGYSGLKMVQANYTINQHLDNLLLFYEAQQRKALAL